ncbi:MAG: hypothetical protein WBD27_07130 [Pyrinomonadaceae bacterium]
MNGRLPSRERGTTTPTNVMEILTNKNGAQTQQSVARLNGLEKSSAEVRCSPTSFQ